MLAGLTRLDFPCLRAEDAVQNSIQSFNSLSDISFSFSMNGTLMTEAIVLLSAAHLKERRVCVCVCVCVCVRVCVCACVLRRVRRPARR